MGKINKSWTNDDLSRLAKYKETGKTNIEIAKLLNRSYNAIRHQLNRRSGSKKACEKNIKRQATDKKTWSNSEMDVLEAMWSSGKFSYSEISQKLGRTVAAIEYKVQKTDWDKWRSHKGSVSDNQLEESVKEELIGQLKEAILHICRYDLKKMNDLTETVFFKKVNFDKAKMPVEFQNIKSMAISDLDKLGLSNPEIVELNAGTYIVVGDSHGSHTKAGVFSLLKNVSSFLKAKNIIHVGHLLDDDNEISDYWKCVDNLIVLSKTEELKIIQDIKRYKKLGFQVVRDRVMLGNLSVTNQDMISDYVKTSISSLDQEIFDPMTIVNNHRLEFYTKCCNEDASYLASPGCLCENHIVRTIKQIDFECGKIVKQAYWDGFSKYRRMKHTNKYWKKGILVVHVDKNGSHTIVPCIIKNINGIFVTSYFDKIITSDGICNPDKKIFVNADVHCDLHDISVLDVQENICLDYRPDVYVNLGDTFNYSSLNHHVMDRGGKISKKVLDESATTNWILKRMSNWAEEKYIICGNHERFPEDFIQQFAQFDGLLDIKFLCNLDSLGYKTLDIKDVLKIGTAKFIHGEIRMYGQTGTKLEKASRTFGDDVFIGHIHRPEIRFGCYSVGLSGKLDQEYNEPNSSDWLHGFGLCNQYKGENFMTTIAIVNNFCKINGKSYIPKNNKSWETPSYKAKISYEYVGN